MAFYRKTGKVDVQKVPVDSTSVIAIGDIVSSDESAGDLIPGATNIAQKGIALEASASGSTAAIKVDVLHPGDRVVGDVSTGTPAATDAGKYADLEDQNSITLTASNNDLRVYYNGTSDTIDATFTTLETGGPATA